MRLTVTPISVLLLLSLLLNFSLFGQDNLVLQPSPWLDPANKDVFLVGRNIPVYQLEEKILLGDKNALFEMAGYFDSTRKVIESLGYHIFETTESQIARRIIRGNCIFTDHEIVITDSTTAKEFLDFLNLNKDKIVYSTLARAFLLTPLEARTSRVAFREISPTRKSELKNKLDDLLGKEWVQSGKIDSLISQKDSKALLLIAAGLYQKTCYRFDQGSFNKDEYTDLLQLITGIEIATENKNKRLAWHLDKEFYPDASLNLLIFFLRNYRHYQWDDRDSAFKNPDYAINPIGKEELLFELLNSKSDSTALDAFTQLTTCDPQKIIQLSDEYEDADIDHNYTAPIFPYRFLKQMVVLTDYCRKNNIDFYGPPSLKRDMKVLETEMSFAERRKLEDKLITTLTLDEITAFEYWALVHEQSYYLTYSVGRILDRFYSRNWSQLKANDNHLRLYLKKSILFDQLGIIGICNNYLKKFINSSPADIDRLGHLQTSDDDITRQTGEARLTCIVQPKRPNDLEKINDANKDYQVTDLEKKLKLLTRRRKPGKKTERKLVTLLSQIDYSQIGTALKAIERISFKNSWEKYSFMERDWGFFMTKDFAVKAARREFLTLYNKLSEYELYAYYLDQAAIDYKNNDNSLDYDKIFDLLKYDVVVAFAGGGGGKMNNEVYCLIKLLEIAHKTTLGYPQKLCNSDGIYGCDSQDRANEWMQYMLDHKLLKQAHNEPVSFHYE